MTKSEKISHAVKKVHDALVAHRIPHIFIADNGDGSVSTTHAGSYQERVDLTATFIKGLTDYIKQDPKVFLQNVANALEADYG